MGSVYWYKGHEILIDDVVKAEGIYVWDSKRNRYIDMESGVWCTPLGHGCKAVRDALTRQINECIHTGYAYTAPVTEESAKKYLDAAGFAGGKCMFLSSGSEAVETGAQIIKKISDKPLLMTFADSFLGSHGTVCTKSPDGWHLFDWSSCENCTKECGECSLFGEIPFSDIAGFIFEPGSSSGLVKFPPDRLIKALGGKIKEHGGFLMANEVTTGAGRTGRMFGYEHYSFAPDIIAAGKGVGNGYPVSCVLMTGIVAEKADKAGFKAAQSHQNDPSGAAAALAVITELEQRRLIDSCRELGEYFVTQLKELKNKYPLVEDVRGRGLMISVTFKDLADSEVYDIFTKLFKDGFIVVKRPGLPVLRIDPPLIISRGEISSFVSALEKILAEY